MFSLMDMEDRAAALVLTSNIDNLLEHALLTKLAPLGAGKRDRLFRNPNAPLSSLSAKIASANALSCLGNEAAAQLERIRSIRNAFAHSMIGLNFETPLIKKECGKLNPQALIAHANYSPELNTSKEAFMMTGVLIMVLLMYQIRHNTDVRLYGLQSCFWRAPSNEKSEWPPPLNFHIPDQNEQEPPQEL